MSNVFQYAQPMIPSGLLREMFEVKNSEGSYDYENGGQWIPGKKEMISFQGVILPIGSKDLERDFIGSYTKTTQKVYTNGYSMKVGTRIYDPLEDITYTVTQELGHNSIHPMKRYLIDSKEGASQR